MIRPPWKYRVKQADVQGNVLANYGIAYRHALYAFVRIEDDVAGRAWLGATADQVTTAERRPDAIKPDYAINVSVSCNGLRALGLPEPLLKTFPEDFRVGMRARAESLGDTGPNDPQHWEDEVWHTEPHVMVTLFALDQPALDQGRTACRRKKYWLRSGCPTRATGWAARAPRNRRADASALRLCRRFRGTDDQGQRWGELAQGRRNRDRSAAGATSHPESPCWATRPRTNLRDRPATLLRPNGTYTVEGELEQRVVDFQRRSPSCRPAIQAVGMDRRRHRCKVARRHPSTKS